MEWKISKQPVDYTQAVQFMEERVNAIIAGQAGELIWLLEHDPLYTAGSSSKESDLLEKRFPVYQSNRGGQYTYHGTGQRIIYVMLDLRKRGQDIKLFVKNLENWIIATLAEFGIKGEIREDRVGVWVENAKSEEKIAAIGIRVRKWVTYHGISVNISPDLSHYLGIIPCGINQFGVTSFAKLGLGTTMQEFDRVLQAKFEDFGQ
ncbi:MAG: lipoyl(octanoyl) transferase LipB [Pseudomonadota bacterium]